MTTSWKYSDGGRKEAGFKGSAGDCGVRALAIATERPYLEVYNRINELARLEKPRNGEKTSSARNGVYRKTLQRYIDEIGWTWTPCMSIGSGCRVHVRASELPSGRLILRLSRHYAAFIDGVLIDTYDSSRGGTRCVYGYWSQS